MNKIAIRILMRVLDTLVEQTSEVQYEGRKNEATFTALGEVLNSLRTAKRRLTDLVELEK